MFMNKKFDHFIFSGPIPRTFLGSTLLTCIVHPFISIAAYLNLISSKADLQIIGSVSVLSYP